MNEQSAQNIGYMQVQFKFFENANPLPLFAINAFDEAHSVKTAHVSSEHQVIPDEAKIHEKILQAKLTVLESNYTIMMHTPIHQSKDWEHLGKFGKYDVYFYCITENASLVLGSTNGA